MQNIAKYDCWDPHEYHLGNDDWFSEIDFTSNVRRKRTAVSEDGDQAGGGWRYTKRPEIDERSKWLIEQQHIRRPDVICERERVFPAMPGRFLTGLDLLIGRDTHDGEGEDGDSGSTKWLTLSPSFLSLAPWRLRPSLVAGACWGMPCPEIVDSGAVGCG